MREIIKPKKTDQSINQSITRYLKWRNEKNLIEQTIVSSHWFVVKKKKNEKKPKHWGKVKTL